jgi:hypothetical protein
MHNRVADVTLLDAQKFLIDVRLPQQDRRDDIPVT